MIDRFTKEQFENSLPVNKNTNEAMWEHIEFSGGEHVYSVPVTNTNKRIVIRSSIGYDGYAADSGNDSIRHWIEYEYKGRWIPLERDEKRWTTRVPGWEGRLKDALRRLWTAAVEDSKKHGTFNNTRKCDSSKGKGGADISRCDTPVTDSAGHGVHKAVESGLHDSGKSEERESEQTVQKVSRDPDSDRKHSSIFDTLSGVKTSLDPDSVHDDDGIIINEPGNKGSDFTPSGLPNEQQRQMIFSDPNKALRVLAGPGAGKTFCLSNRYGFLMSKGVRPDQIVTVTFNRQMADEAMERIAAINPVIREMRAYEPESGALRQINTIHGLCLYMLREDGDKRTVPGGNSRVKTWMLKKELEEIIDGFWLDPDEQPTWTEVLSLIDSAKLNSLTSENDMRLFGGIHDKFGNNIGSKLHAARVKFDEYLRRNKIITFADMLFDVDQKLKTDAQFRAKWQARITHVLVDEGQDTNGQAMRILTTIASPQNNLNIVGDTDQLLYRFIGATPERNLFDGFEAMYPDNNTVFLGINYRSTQQIITTYTKLIRHNYQVECLVCGGTGTITNEDDEEESCEACQGLGNFTGPYDGKYLKTITPNSDEDGVPVTFNMYPSPEAEATAVAERIKEALDNGANPDDFFVASRTRAQTGYLEGPLMRLDIPYINLNGRSFWDMKHVSDVIAYLKLAVNEDDFEAFKRVYNIASSHFVHPWGEKKGAYCNHRYLGKAFLDACTDVKEKEPMYKWRWTAASKRRSYQPGVEDLENLLNAVRAELEAGGVSSALTMIIEDCYEPYLNHEEGSGSDDDGGSGKSDDLYTVVDVASEFTSAEEFLKYVEKIQKAAQQAVSGDWNGHVVLSTIHKLKGKERPVVIGVGLVEGQDKKGAPIGLLPHTYSLRPAQSKGVIDLRNQGRIEDERDIAYVLVSRAKKECHLTGPATYRNNTMWASRFVREMGLV